MFGVDLAVITYRDAGRVQDPAEAEQVTQRQVVAELGFHVMAHDVPRAMLRNRGGDSFLLLLGACVSAAVYPPTSAR